MKSDLVLLLRCLRSKSVPIVNLLHVRWTINGVKLRYLSIFLSLILFFRYSVDFKFWRFLENLSFNFFGRVTLLGFDLIGDLDLALFWRTILSTAFFFHPKSLILLNLNPPFWLLFSPMIDSESSTGPKIRSKSAKLHYFLNSYSEKLPWIHLEYHTSFKLNLLEISWFSKQAIKLLQSLLTVNPFFVSWLMSCSPFTIFLYMEAVYLLSNGCDPNTR